MLTDETTVRIEARMPLAAMQGEEHPPLLAAVRFGRALGTWARRQKKGDATLVVGRTGNEPCHCAARDGLVAGLALAGHHVVDGGVIDIDHVEAIARTRGAVCAVLVEGDENEISLRPTRAFAKSSLDDALIDLGLLDEVQAILEEGAFSTKPGTVERVDTPQ